jgi:hypothetical protein
LLSLVCKIPVLLLGLSATNTIGYYGVAGNVGSLLGVYRHVERYWRTMLSSRSQKGKVRWERFLAIKRKYPLQRPQLSLPYTRLKQYAVL